MGDACGGSVITENHHHAGTGPCCSNTTLPNELPDLLAVGWGVGVVPAAEDGGFSPGAAPRRPRRARLPAPFATAAGLLAWQSRASAF